MKKYPIIIVTLVLFFSILAVAIFQYRSQPSTFIETVPLILKTTTATPTTLESFITPSITTSPISDIQESVKNIDSNISFSEKDKVIDFLPYRIERNLTSVGVVTDVIIESTDRDPVSALRIGIFGINYAEKDPNGKFAIAFRESFLEAKKILVSKGVNLKNLQIAYSDYQYAQDTATYWVSAFKLLE